MALPRQAKFAIAQLGRKSGAATSLGLLLTASDLPGGNWKMLDERSWKAGTVGPDTPWGKRTRDAKKIVGWRSFEQQSSEKGMWIQVVPYVSDADARSALAGVKLGDGIKNSRAKIQVISESVIEDFVVPGVDAVRVLIQSTWAPRGEGEARTICSAIDSYVAIEAFGGFDRAWNDVEMSLIATLQANRIRNHPKD